VASITLTNASVELPIYNAAARSLRNSIFRRIGGKVGSNSSDVVTVKALNDITMSVNPGDRLAILGHNGAGKSTILRVFSGAYEPSSGTAEVSGSVSSLLDITMGMDPELTGAENVILRGAFVGLSIKEARDRIAEIEEYSELGGFMNLPIRTYSSGMILRLAFAVSTVRHRDILLLDELISVGDRSFVAKARQRIETMIDGASILVLASHDLDTVKQYCNRAILLQSGNLIADGPVEDVIERYQNIDAEA
jgi:ABC-2 type transport system ATP-binding protein/lipopolysaccharide transport system ATP-binding protein